MRMFMSDSQPNEFSRTLDEHMLAIVKRLIEEERVQIQTREGEMAINREALRLHDAVQRIMSKEFISAREAAILLNCSERHIHNLVDRARRGLTDNPIPYRKIGETTTFLRTELIEWTKVRPPNQLRAVG